MRSTLFPLFLALLLAPSRSEAINPVSYDFGGTLSDQFMDSFPGIDFFDQAGGVLSYHNNGVSVSDNEEFRAHKTFLPSYAESWSISVDATVPGSYDGAAAAAEAELSVGLFASTVVGSTRYSFANELLLANPLASPGTLSRTALAGWEFGPDGGISADGGGGGLALAPATVSLSVSFDAGSKVLSAFADGAPVYLVDIGPSGANWGLSDSDTFNVGLLGLSFDHAVPPAGSLSLDNFVGVPEPGSTLLLSSAALLGLLRRRRG